MEGTMSMFKLSRDNSLSSLSLNSLIKKMLNVVEQCLYFKNLN